MDPSAVAVVHFADVEVMSKIEMGSPKKKPAVQFLGEIAPLEMSISAGLAIFCRIAYHKVGVCRFSCDSFG